MLNAIVHGKGRRLPDDVRPGDSLRKTFIRAEDLLTATIFERLAYLRGPLLHSILGRAFGSHVLGEAGPVVLTEMEFWPTWGQARSSLGGAVEPDVVMRLSIGEPARCIVLIVECKLGGFQSADQWAREWIAHEAEIATSEPPDEVWLLAVGGLDGRAQDVVTRITEEVRQNWERQIQVAAADWLDILRAIEGAEPQDEAERRILHDIQEALRLYGYRHISPMADLAALVERYALKVDSISRLAWRRDAADPLYDAPSAPWRAIPARFRPIGIHPCLRRKAFNVR